MLFVPFFRCRSICLAIFAIPVLMGLSTYRVSAQIYNDQTYAVIPGTQGITPGPGVDLSNWDTTGHTLYYAELGSFDLTGANFSMSNLGGADFYSSNLTNGSFRNSNLTDSDFFESTLTNADFSNANISGVVFYSVVGLAANQIYATANYQSHKLGTVQFEYTVLTGWSFANQNLAGTGFSISELTTADFTNATVNNASFYSVAMNASQLYSTASYQKFDLSNIALEEDDLQNWNFVNQNLTGANFSDSVLTNADLTGATINNTCFGNNTVVAPSQIYSTASYQSRHLTGINFLRANITGWNFANQNLTNAQFQAAHLIDVNFSNANLSGTNFVGTIMIGANFSGAYFSATAFDNANLTDANLAGSVFTAGTYPDANFADADLRQSTGWSVIGTDTPHDAIYPDGTIRGLAMNASELLTIRNNPLSITATGNATFDPASTLQFLLDTNWTSPIGFIMGIVPSLAGTLDLELADDANPANLVGTTFQLFSWNGPLPWGDQFGAITSEPGFVWDTSQLYTTGTVTLDAVPEPAAASAFAIATIALIASRRR
jgi:uncharacterized protein YjbI with pentapeptide repeats